MPFPSILLTHVDASPLNAPLNAPVSLFQNLALGKASTDDKCHIAIPWTRYFQHEIVCKFFQNIPNGLIVNFYFFIRI